MAKQNIFGLVFDTKTGKVTFDDGEIPAVGGDFTFEDHPGYNPLQYATDKTGEKIVATLTSALPAGIEYSLFRTKVVQGMNCAHPDDGPRSTTAAASSKSN